MVFSPDFFDYFRQLAPLLETDPTIWCISSWNDNGKKGLVMPDSTAVYRTDFFLGFPWLIKKEFLPNPNLNPNYRFGVAHEERIIQKGTGDEMATHALGPLDEAARYQ